MIKDLTIVCCLSFAALLGISCDALRDNNPVDPFGISRITNISGEEIRVDGKPDDWDTIEPIATDPIGDNEGGAPGTDITEVYMQYAVSTSTLYLRIDLENFAGQPDVIYSVAFDLDVNDNWDYVVHVSRDRKIVTSLDLRRVDVDMEALNYKSTGRRGIPMQLEGEVKFDQEEVCELGIPMGRILEGDRDFAVCPFITIAESGSTADVVNKFIRVTY